MQIISYLLQESNKECLNNMLQVIGPFNFSSQILDTNGLADLFDCAVAVQPMTLVFLLYEYLGLAECRVEVVED